MKIAGRLALSAAFSIAALHTAPTTIPTPARGLRPVGHGHVTQCHRDRRLCDA